MHRRAFLASASLCIADYWGMRRADAANPNQTNELASLQEILKAKSQILPLHEMKKPNQPGDWLEQHKESGQTFDEFLARKKDRVCQQYRAIYIQLLGEFSKSQRTVVEQTVDFMGRFFGMPVELLADRSLAELPEQARRVHPIQKVPQVLSTHLLDQVLKPHRPKDAVAVLGLTAEDLWPGKNWNFVYGQASLSERVGVWSLSRNGNVDGSIKEQRMFLRRTLGTAVHETGHMLGTPHCIAFECGMNGSNNRAEADRQPLEFCPECQAKVSWACGRSWLIRYKQLIDFGRQYGLHEEVEFWTRSLAAIEG